MGYESRDALLKNTLALPASASASVYSAGIDLGHGTRGDFVAPGELLISAPAVNATMAPDTRTFTYFLQHDTDPAFGTVATLAALQIVQTGAAGAGAAAATARFRPQVDVNRYVRLAITSGGSTADASAVSATLELLL